MEIITARKLKGRIKKVKSEELEFHLRDIYINGDIRGCSGFVKNSKNGNVVYVTTEKSCYQPLADKNMYRNALDLKDYSGKGGYNQWSQDETLPRDIVRELLTIK